MLHVVIFLANFPLRVLFLLGCIALFVLSSVFSVQLGHRLAGGGGPCLSIQYVSSASMIDLGVWSRIGANSIHFENKSVICKKYR